MKAQHDGATDNGKFGRDFSRTQYLDKRLPSASRKLETKFLGYMVPRREAKRKRSTTECLDGVSWFLSECRLSCFDLEKGLLQAHRLLGAHEVISEGQNAQLILQNIGMDKMKQTLFEKEKPKKNDRSILFPGGKGRHLTDPEIITAKREMEHDKKRE
ncbi:hypothetical protein B0H14DRAFT_2559677 [Mycena olivaceomarginata]|nr:hypothetical protein B0H14DRAFT_2559677 [Mycena olivaceomarginata]